MVPLVGGAEGLAIFLYGGDRRSRFDLFGLLEALNGLADALQRCGVAVLWTRDGVPNLSCDDPAQEHEEHGSKQQVRSLEVGIGQLDALRNRPVSDAISDQALNLHREAFVPGVRLHCADVANWNSHRL
ncbi:uncharacterized protein LOC119769409 [Culex quinquefasciatus]|uniref:uncharacterized protein LOC119769409 n=1 Tax=Culex quinquefasciatus TaxID=7176 RepID=UPI0018E329A5|nr:uncharacterized protein LOC119769409 [Culex quinquefasciatus]